MRIERLSDIRIERLSDAILEIEKNLEHLKKSLEELKGKSFTMGCYKRDLSYLELENLLGKFHFLLSKRGVDYFYNDDDLTFRQLLDDKYYGLKAILLLCDAMDIHARENDILYRVFPWIEKATLEDLCEDSIFTIGDWLIVNYSPEMIDSFLDKELKMRK